VKSCARFAATRRASVRPCPTRCRARSQYRSRSVSGSSGAEYLDAERLAYEKFADLADALNVLATGKTAAVVNSVGALQYRVNTRFSDAIAPPRGVLAPAYMALEEMS
jgi:polar amino acid transport system substrate-binding protein